MWCKFYGCKFSISQYIDAKCVTVLHSSATYSHEIYLLNQVIIVKMCENNSCRKLGRYLGKNNDALLPYCHLSLLLANRCITTAT